jgi:predicted transcriptional regulator
MAMDELGPLEMQVLGLLDAGEALSVAAVRARLHAAGTDLAYTTVLTVLVRLRTKGVVERVKDKNRFLYLRAKSANRVSTGILANIHRRLFSSDRARPILALLDDGDLSVDELKSLRRLIDDKLRTKKPGEKP